MNYATVFVVVRNVCIVEATRDESRVISDSKDPSLLSIE